MFDTKSIVYKAVIIINLLFVAVGVFLSVLSIVNENGTIACQICGVFNIYALLFAGYYILAGYKKNAAKFYKVYALLFAISQSILLFYICSLTTEFILIFLTALALSVILTLLFGRNMGKKVSLILCGILVLFAVLLLIFLLIYVNKLILLECSIVNLILVSLCFVLTYAKYVDKATRNAK